MPEPRPVQPVIPGISRRRARPPRRKEDALQSQIRATLGTLGYGSFEIGAKRKRVTCPCGCRHNFWPTGWQGNTPGAPDVVVWHDAWPAGVMLAFECKGDGTPTSRIQADLMERRRVILARDVAGPLAEVQWVENLLARAGCSGARERSARIVAFIRDNAGRLG